MWVLCDRRLWAARSSQISSDEPPPISNTSARSQLEIDEGRAARHGEPGLRLARHHLDVEVRLPAHAAQELRRIVRQPAGFRGDEPGPLDAVAPYLGCADLQRVQGALDRLLRQAAGGGNAFAQANDAREGVNDAEALRRRACHQKAAVVSAEIERCVGACGAARPFPVAALRLRERWIERSRPVGGQRSRRPTRTGRLGGTIPPGSHAPGRRRTGAALIVPLHRPSPAPALFQADQAVRRPFSSTWAPL